MLTEGMSHYVDEDYVQFSWTVQESLRLSVSDACQINDFDHNACDAFNPYFVSDACQINDFDHASRHSDGETQVSDACQINDFDHNKHGVREVP